MKKYFLEIVVFICGAVVMIFELVGSRVLGPYLGTSLFIWTSLIGIILGSLSLGYFLGGIISDRKSEFRILAWIIFSAALFIGLTTISKDYVLAYLPRLFTGLKVQSVVAAIILFAPASVFLGMVSPYAVKLKLRALEATGRTVGNLYAISTIGSIAGTFGAGFFIIPAFGSSNILYYLAALLAVIAMIIWIVYGKKSNSIYALLFALVVIALNISYNLQSKEYIDIDTRYNRVLIYDGLDPISGKQVKFMRLNNELSSAMFLDSDDLVYDYTRFYKLAAHFNPGFQNALIIGGAAYSFPRYFVEAYENATIDVVEIDPELTRLAKEHFRLRDNDRMSIYHEDGRTFLNTSTNKYDVIYGDAFKSYLTLPWHLTTLEAVQKQYDILNEGGIVMVNIISSIEGKGSEFLQAELATFREVFPQVYLFAVQNPEDRSLMQSISLIAVKSNNPVQLSSSDPEWNELMQHNITSLVKTNLPVLTDDFAPVDNYTNKAL